MFVVGYAKREVSENKETRIPAEKLISYVFQDLLAVSERVVGIDGKVALKEVDAINELFEQFGYKTNWSQLKSAAPKNPPQYHVSDVLKVYAESEFITYKTLKEKAGKDTLEETLNNIDIFLSLWTAFMCEIIIADRNFTQKESEPLTKYIVEFCKYVTIIFGRAFLISKRVSDMINKAIILCG